VRKFVKLHLATTLHAEATVSADYRVFFAKIKPMWDASQLIVSWAQQEYMYVTVIDGDSSLVQRVICPKHIGIRLRYLFNNECSKFIVLSF